MASSIRGSLIAWFSALLFVVLGAFGSLLYARASDAADSGVHRDLDGKARAIEAALDLDDQDGWELDLSDQYLAGLTAGGYFAVFDRDGNVMRSGGTLDRATFRTIERAGPNGTRVVVGRSVAAERAELRALVAAIFGTGVAVLAVALLGGWWLARRSVAPIRAMAETAARISERDLSARLDATRVPGELKVLAEAFNATLARLEAAFTKQARFTADASHELRTPVSVVRTQAEVALKQDRPAGEYRAALEACLRAAERMTGVVEGLLTLARADAGEAATARERVDLGPVVAEVAALLAREAEAEGVTIRCAPAAGAPAIVHGDPALLGEVVSNLIANAVRYNRPGGTVDVALAARNGAVELTVADTGIGIPAGALPQVFERFYRVDAARSRERGGSGLGLAITRWIVEAHGGAIHVDSRPKEGSTFTVRLPAAGTP